MSTRTRQCKACPWKKSTVPDRDIPGGYERGLHEMLEDTIAEPGSPAGIGKPMRVFACHESTNRAPQACVGWVVNQLGPGNNIAMRLAALDGRYRNLRTVGPQHEHFRDTLPACSAKRVER